MYVKFAMKTNSDKKKSCMIIIFIWTFTNMAAAQNSEVMSDNWEVERNLYT
jgi:hypothetical protein